jgi:transposase-like protein
MRGRPKGRKNRQYTVEEKLSIVNMNLQDHIAITQLEKETGIANSVILGWIHRYLNEGIDGLKNKKKTGNVYAALSTSKSLSKEERLELENMKLKIENERLKKGYLVKGVGADKEYVTFLGKSMK